MPIEIFQPDANEDLYSTMPCHTFALSADTGALAGINGRYNQLGQYLLGNSVPPDNLRGRIEDVLAEIGDDQRIATMGLLRDQFGMAPGNGTGIRLWGLFRNEMQMLPEHMWITMGGMIYDTMPEAPIRRNNNVNGTNPPSEGHALAPNVIFSVEVAALHIEQMNVINSQNWEDE